MPDAIAIVGLGYVGLPLALQFLRSGVRVVGLDVDPVKVEALNAGRSYIHHLPAAEFAPYLTDGHFRASTEFAALRGTDAVLICVPTPLTRNREPDLSHVLNTGRALAPHLTPGMLVVLESTTYPGTTDGELRGVLESGSGLRAGTGFHLAYSPEREDPGNPRSRVSEIPKLVGGFTPACRDLACALYSQAVRTVVPVSSCRVAEAAKLTENIFRGVNIALVNELKVVFAAMGIDVWEVIEAARTKPFGFMPFFPGPGLGGHCVPIDPFYLAWKAREFGQATRFIELAGEINTAMPAYVVGRVAEALNEAGRPVKGSRILVLGLAYKAGVDDDRESPSYHLMDLLQSRGAQVYYHDPFVPVIRPNREHAHWAGTRSVAWSEAEIRSMDAVVISTAHPGVNYAELATWAPRIVDTRNALAGVPMRPGQLWKA